VDNSGPDVEVLGYGFAGDSHFVEIPDVGTHLEFEKVGGGEVDDLLLGGHLVESEGVFGQGALLVNVDLVGVKVVHRVAWVVTPDALVVELAVILVQRVETVDHAVGQHSVV
jgi:hypothetical protein